MSRRQNPSLGYHGHPSSRMTEAPVPRPTIDHTTQQTIDAVLFNSILSDTTNNRAWMTHPSLFGDPTPQEGIHTVVRDNPFYEGVVGVNDGAWMTHPSLLDDPTAQDGVRRVVRGNYFYVDAVNGRTHPSPPRDPTAQARSVDGVNDGTRRIDPSLFSDPTAQEGIHTIVRRNHFFQDIDGGVNEDIIAYDKMEAVVEYNIFQGRIAGGVNCKLRVGATFPRSVDGVNDGTQRINLSLRGNHYLDDMDGGVHEDIVAYESLRLEAVVEDNKFHGRIGGGVNRKIRVGASSRRNVNRGSGNPARSTTRRRLPRECTA